MKGTKEFFERINSDKAFLDKFTGIDDEDKIITLARSEGYDLEQLDDEELDKVAGGTITELSELNEAMYKADCRFYGEGHISTWDDATGVVLSHIPGLSVVSIIGTKVKLLDYGVSANIDVGLAGTGLFSKSNSYIDTKTGEKLTHKQVLKRIK